MFISYAKEDRNLVEQVVTELESSGRRCWVSYRDIPGGESSWAGAIAGAIATSRMVVVIVTRNSIGSKQVLREVTLADDENIPFVPFCLDDAPLSKDLRYFFSTAQRLEVGELRREEAIGILNSTIANRLAYTV